MLRKNFLVVHCYHACAPDLKNIPREFSIYTSGIFGAQRELSCLCIIIVYVYLIKNNIA